MPIFANVNDFTIPANKTSGNIIVSGTPFQPEAAFYIGGSFTNENNVVNSGVAHFTAFITVSGAYHSTNTKLNGGQDLRDGDTRNAGSWLYDYRSIVNMRGGDLDTWKFIPSGTHLLPDRLSWPVNTKITYLFLDGEDLVRSYVGNYNGLAGTGFINVTSPGFKPDVLIDFSMYYVGMNSSSTTNNCSYGWATSSGNQSGVAWVSALATVINNDTVGYNDALAKKISTSKTVTANIKFVEFTPSGFILNQTVGGTGTHRYVVLKGGKWAVGNLNTSTVSGNIINNVIGFEPQAVLFLSALRPYASGISDHNSQSYGIATRYKDQPNKCWANWETDGINPSRVFYAHTDSIYTNLRESNIVGKMNWYGIIESGFSTIMTLPDISENFVTFLAIGDDNQPVRTKQKAWVYGKTFDNHKAWVYGHDPLGLEIRAYTAGGILTNDSKSAYTAGGIKVSDSTSAYTDFKLSTIFSRTGYFNIDTSKTEGQYLVVSGLDFQPKLLLLWWVGGTIPSGINMHSPDWCGDSADVNIGFGAAIDSTHRFCIVGASEDSVSTMNSIRSQNNTEIMRTYILSSGSAILDGKLDFYSFNTDGYTLVYDKQFSGLPYTAGYIAIGGTDLTNLYIGQTSIPTTSGYFEITDVGFKPDALIIATAASTSVIQENDGSSLSLGFADTKNNQSVISIVDKDASFDAYAKKYTSIDKIYANISFTSAILESAGSLVGFTSSGFILNNLYNSSAYILNYIALKGGIYNVTQFTSANSNGIYTVSGIGFRPTTLILTSVINLTNNVVQGDNETSIGFTTINYGQEYNWRGFSQIAQYSEIYDTYSSSSCWYNYSDISYINADYWGLIDIIEFNDDGFVYRMADYDNNNFINVFSIGEGGNVESSKKAYINVEAFSEENIYAFTEGTLTNFRVQHFAYTKGLSNTTSTHSAYLLGAINTNDSKEVYINTIASTNNSKYAYVYGKVFINDSQNAYVIGQVVFSIDAYVEGYLPNVAIKHAYLKGTNFTYGPDAWIS